LPAAVRFRWVIFDKFLSQPNGLKTKNFSTD